MKRDPEPNTLTERIEQAIELLDKHKPSWRDSIDLTMLDMEYPSRCVLGEVYGDYREGVSRLWSRKGYFDRFNLAERYAFQCPMLPRRGHTTSYDYLTRAWRKALRAHGIGRAS